MDAETVELESELGDIDDVKKSAHYYVWHYHAALFVFVIIASVCASIVLGYFAYIVYSLDSKPDSRIFGLTILPLFAILVVYSHFLSKVQHLFVQEIAQNMGFDYAESGDVSTLSGLVFGLGHSRTMSDVMTGIYRDAPMRLFSFETTIGAGKSSHTYALSVFEIEYTGILPHVLMSTIESGAYAMTSDFNPSSLSDMEKVRLEGNFNSQFSLYVEKGMQMEVREIFQPDVMEHAMQIMLGSSMELSGSKVYLIKDGVLTSKADFLDFLADAQLFYDELVPTFSSVSEHSVPVSMPVAPVFAQNPNEVSAVTVAP